MLVVQFRMTLSVDGERPPLPGGICIASSRFQDAFELQHEFGNAGISRQFILSVTGHGPLLRRVVVSPASR